MPHALMLTLSALFPDIQELLGMSLGFPRHMAVITTTAISGFAARVPAAVTVVDWRGGNQSNATYTRGDSFQLRLLFRDIQELLEMSLGFPHHRCPFHRMKRKGGGTQQGALALFILLPRQEP